MNNVEQTLNNGISRMAASFERSFYEGRCGSEDIRNLADSDDSMVSCAAKRALAALRARDIL